MICTGPCRTTKQLHSAAHDLAHEGFDIRIGDEQSLDQAVAGTISKCTPRHCDSDEVGLKLLIPMNLRSADEARTANEWTQTWERETRWQQVGKTNGGGLSRPPRNRH
uniref:Uncharacterized protein n=1 Tax=Spongospora subterranea TaxID=70186 RepID=A0A0H5QNG0_9EUKA|eukprot:CRZ02916.1 hypothetical protein [Spongospora subterranea]